MNNKFAEYFKENFFWEKKEFDKFIFSLTKNLKKTLRINTSKISSEVLLKKMKDQNYITTGTISNGVYYIERWDNFIEFEKRLGFTLEHLLWYFYIQELWASTSVNYLCEGKIDMSPFLILDMASSPWGKTTQLSEYYPNSFIVANEFDSNRTPQLIANIDRMWSSNIWITNYNWQYLWRFSETFDKILLDAPCSWEWIWFKTIDALKFWNIKNVKKISDLQKKLIEASFNALKVWWELLYSTCTMNKLENEWVISHLEEKYPWSLEIMLTKRFWPHIDETGWFFVCKIKKIKSIDYKTTRKEELSNKKIEELTKNDERIIKNFSLKSWIDFEKYKLFKYSNEVILLNSNYPYSSIRDRLYFFKLGKKIGRIEGQKFLPNYYIGRDFGILDIPKYNIESEIQLDKYLRWFEIWEWLSWDYIQLIFKDNPIWLWEINEDWKIKNTFPKVWHRK